MVKALPQNLQAAVCEYKITCIQLHGIGTDNAVKITSEPHDLHMFDTIPTQ